MYKRILVPVDGSPTSGRGLKEALRLAKVHRARLCLLHVVEQYFVAQAGEAIVYAEDMFDALKAGGRKVLARAQATAKKAGVPAQSVLVESIAQPVADVIVRQARRFKADLIVLGTHGRRGVRRLVLGSDAEQVLRRSAVPVLLVRAGRG
jgi:nucleotide-binding universal stress UspA family protein